MEYDHQYQFIQSPKNNKMKRRSWSRKKKKSTNNEEDLSPPTSISPVQHLCSVAIACKYRPLLPFPASTHLAERHALRISTNPKCLIGNVFGRRRRMDKNLLQEKGGGPCRGRSWNACNDRREGFGRKAHVERLVIATSSSVAKWLWSIFWRGGVNLLDGGRLLGGPSHF